ncbi:MAG: HD domain-containing phosphohydrolase [bacterium]
MMKKKILFVDDEPGFLDGIRRVLHGERHEWDLTFAYSVDEALAKAKEISFDGIVSDINMPVKDGLTLLKALRECETTREIPVVVLTGKGDADLKRRALDLGATDLLSKPINREDLIARIRSILKLKDYQDRLKKQNEDLDQKVIERTKELDASRLEIILRLGKASEYRDEETGNHVIRVACYSRALARQLGMSPAFMDMIFLAAPLHDVGKIGIPDRILLKPGKLTSEEIAVMKSHCTIGAEILLYDPKSVRAIIEWQNRSSLLKKERAENPILKMASVIALSHHERWDGSGYPKGLAGEEIPIEARILSLADVYDALRSKRPYKPSFTEEETINIIHDETGTHFDPKVSAAFDQVTQEFRNVLEQFSEKEGSHDIEQKKDEAYSFC